MREECLSFCRTRKAGFADIVDEGQQRLVVEEDLSFGPDGLEQL